MGLTTTLAHLPSDVMGILTLYCAHSDLVALLMTGNRALIANLQRHGSITKLVVNLARAEVVGTSGARHRVAPLLYQLRHLQHLEIRASDYIKGPLDDFDLNWLTPTLRTLAFYASNAADLFKTPLHSSTWFNFGQSLPQLTKLQTSLAITAEKAPWVSSLPPTLTFLECDSFETNVMLPSSVMTIIANQYWQTSDPVLLPSSLTRILIANTYAGATDLLIATLPPCFESYEAPYSDTHLTQEHLHLMPDSMRTLEARKFKWKENPPPSFPSSLTRLTLPCPPSPAFWKLLPVTLQHLRWTTNSSVPSYPGYLQEAVQYLPRALETFWSDFGSKSNLIGDLRLPSGLKSFVVDGLVLDRDAFFSLPPTLTTYHTHEIEASHALHLPPVLTELRMTKFPITTQNFEKLPSTLKILHISEDSLGVGDHFPEEAREAFLTRCERKTFRWPPALVKLDLDRCPVVGDEMVLGLPDTLTYASLDKALYITNEGVKTFGKCRSLTTLDVSSANLLTSVCFRHLPSNLRFLEFSGTGEIYDDDIPDLPRSLRYVYMLNATRLTGKCLSSFPPLTSTLRLDNNSLIAEKDLTLLSARLRYGRGSTFCSTDFRISSGTVSHKRRNFHQD